MSSMLKQPLTAELRAVIDQNFRDRTPYTNPSEFARDLLREKRTRIEAA